MKVSAPPPGEAKNGDIRGALPWVTGLDSAYDAYWSAHSPREDQAAYHEILLFGGRDGYAGTTGWFPETRAALARFARVFALWVERR